MAYTLQDKMYNGSIICTAPQAPPTKEAGHARQKLMKNTQCTQADIYYSCTCVCTYKVTSRKCMCAARAKVMQAQAS